ncbi:hypothetical protein LCN94_06430 [Ruminococcus sp. FMB-CY1]|uniref:InlB B-repeat-containing protein n=1 Tax=unclassified Ruminococcus TaxID=2608920 RepID=UPI00208F4533|nr:MULTISPECIES: hypothetical protein [unclassified Ruminococcus]USP70105.1 hypothetical protein KGF34_01865 [Ruminococcus sp. FMBCY1]WBX56579.1 hypothetical protein LCN94_06430 [Ruminococcus sp. FMB-CY1]
MKTNFKRIGKQSISIVLAVMMMLSTMLVGMVTSNAANETGYTYNQDYMYVDLSAVSKTMSGKNSGVNYYWDDHFTNYGGWITNKKDLGNYTYKFDFSAIGSHEYFRGFKIVWDGSAGTNIAVLENNTYNCVKVNSDYTLSWTTYSSTEPTTKYTVTVDKNITNGTVTPSATSLEAGKTFTVTATPDDGYELDAITVTTADGKSVAATDESTHTYTMPASNVTVSATFKVKTDAKYSVTYTAPTGEGVVDSSINPTETTLAAGTTVKVTVTVNEGYTASLAVDGATVTTSTSGNTYTFTFSMPAQNITVAPKVTKAGENTGTLIPNLYLIYSDSSSKPSDFTQYLNLYYNSDNQVYAYFDESNFDDSKEYCFMISNSKGESTSWEYAYDHYNNSKTLSDSEQLACGSSDNWLPKAGQSQYVQAVFAKFKVRDAYVGTISSVKINLGYYDGKDIVESSTDSSKATTYEVIPTSGVEGMVRVFAKDGTVRATYQKYADMADTVLTAENTADLTKYAKKDYYDTAYAKVGTKLKITTTIGDDYKGTYFVKAFSINGYSYGIIDASQADTTDGVYTCEYTIPEDFKGSRIEITPIYYYIDDTDTVTFYVEGFDEIVQAKWGNTVAVQAWYTNGVEKDEFNSLTKNALGGYPGQPLVYEGGKYSMQIPKYLNGNKANTVSGITLNNYFWDDIHKQSFSDTSDKSESNCQTYDYDDFYKLSETADVDNIIFDFRYRTTIDNAPKDNLTNSTYNPDELEPLKDYSGNIVDIFGNILSKDWTAEYDSEYLTVISDGYKNNENIGKYATEWSVYAHDGTYITTINCSSLIDETKVDPAYQVAYNKLKQQYAGLPVKIAYEMSKFDGYDKGTRADGRWYFSKKAQKISANVKIEYRADDTSPFIEDAFVADSNVGEKTGAKAYFTNADYNGKTTCQGEVDGGNFSVHAQTDANANYYFLGWYLKTSDGYSFITNESDTDIPMTNNATYVARFINTPSGTLTLSHTLLDGSAYGKTFIKADIIDSANNVKASIDETSGNLVIPSKYVTYTSTYIIRLTLRTVPYGNDTVEGFYEGYSSDKPVRYNKDFTGTGEQTYSVERAISSLFEEIKNADGSISYKLKKSNIPFYSNITSNPLEYTITYTYKTRLNGEQSYVIKDKVSGIELEEMWAENVVAGLTKEQLSKAFIIRKAPFVSNFREVITWDMDKATINSYVATVSANTTTVDLNISALTVDGQWTLPAKVKYGELAKSSDGDYLYKTGTTEFPEKFNYSGTTKYDFSFWAIFDNKDEAQKYSDAVKAYMLGNPDPDMSKRLTALTKLDGYKNLISKSYSKEYNYISYQNYYIVPVYAGRFAKNEIKEAQASIRLLEYTRNQWTNANGVKGDGSLNVDGSKTDYLYTDFALSFDKDQKLIKNNANIKVGVTFEVVAKYNDINDLKSYETTSNKDAIGNLVKDATANGKVGTYTMDGAERNVYKYEINNSNISVKNRIEYYLRFKNSETSQQNVMKVYSYIYDTVSGKIYLSDPVYMNMYDIGNLTYITSDLANINLDPDATV